MPDEAQWLAARLRDDLAPLRVATRLSVKGSHPAVAWAESGAMALTGAADGPALQAPGAPASALQAALSFVPGPDVPGVQLLGERAASHGFTRNAPGSPGGAFLALRAGNGWLGLSLARPSDADLVGALVGSSADDMWAAAGEWLATQDVDVAAARAHLLGIPAAVIGTPAARRPVEVMVGGARRLVERPLVIDLSSLWAGPLCAHLLGLAGARVIKVESADRLDGARRGPPAFFDLLHGTHESVVLDFDTQRAELARLVGRADVVLEASRPRALRQLGLDAAAFAAAGGIWASITAYGRRDPMRVGFGDDVAAGAGLVTWVDGHPAPVGDAIADPLAGAYAAAAVSVALRSRWGCLLDVSMHDVAAEAASVEVEQRTDLIASPPRARPVVAHAPEAGSDTEQVLAEF